jgi:hypothetical protein
MARWINENNVFVKTSPNNVKMAWNLIVKSVLVNNVTLRYGLIPGLFVVFGVF